MNRQETIKMFSLIGMLYPKDKDFSNAAIQTVEAWQRVLKDVPFEVAEMAVQRHATLSKYVPSLSDILENTAVVQNPGLRMTSDEVWGYVIAGVRKYGRNLKEKAFAEMPVEVAEFAKKWYIEICESEVDDTSIIRSQFCKAWDMYQQRKKDDAVLPDYIKQVGEKMKLSDGYDKDFNSIHRIAE